MSLISLLPPNARSLIEVGTNNVEMIKQYRKIYPSTFYQIIERDSSSVSLARRVCDVVHNADIETASEALFAHFALADCWIFNRSMERLSNPWHVLLRIRKHISADASIVALISNGQRNLLKKKLYDKAPHLDSSKEMHLFSRASMIEMFQKSGYAIANGFAILGDERDNEESILAAAHQIALSIGANPEEAVQDIKPAFYLVKAVPV